MLTMSVLRKVAREHGLVCLLHEKPFAGVNGSGKHNNWSLSTDAGRNLLSPKRTVHENLEFLTIVTAVVRALDSMRTSCGPRSPTRPTTCDSVPTKPPPAILSIFVGHMLQNMIDELNRRPSIGPKGRRSVWAQRCRRSSSMPAIETGPVRSPSPATSSSSTPRARRPRRLAQHVLNTMIAESLDHIATRFEEAIQDGMDETARDEAVRGILADIMQQHDQPSSTATTTRMRPRRNAAACPIWSAADGCLRPQRTRPSALMLGVMSVNELEARVEVLHENYASVLAIEARTMLNMVDTQVIPAAARYQSELADTVAGTRRWRGFIRDQASTGHIGGTHERTQAATDDIRTAMTHCDGWVTIRRPDASCS